MWPNSTAAKTGVAPFTRKEALGFVLVATALLRLHDERLHNFRCSLYRPEGNLGLGLRVYKL